MEDQSQLLAQLDQYLISHPAEENELRSIQQFVHSFDGEALYSRKNFTGHITASAFIYHQLSKQVLMIKHKSLNRWLQPGGHVEETDANIFAASLREAVEETGIDAKHLEAVAGIFDIDSHQIPANARKAEDAHVHHDIRYLFICNNKESARLISSEVAGCEWINLHDLKTQPDFSRVAEKLANDRK